MKRNIAIAVGAVLWAALCIWFVARFGVDDAREQQHLREQMSVKFEDVGGGGAGGSP